MRALPKGITLPDNWREIQRDTLFGVTDITSLCLTQPPKQVWQVVDKVPDEAVLAYDEQDARDKLGIDDDVQLKRVR